MARVRWFLPLMLAAACSPGATEDLRAQAVPSPTRAAAPTATPSEAPSGAPAAPAAPLPAAPSPSSAPHTPPAPAPPDLRGSRAVAAEPVLIRYRLERRTTDPGTAGFEAEAEATLSDPRGWSRAGFRLVHDEGGPYTIVLAEGPEVDALCLPYETWGSYSCQNGPVVALNAERWRTAHPKWTGDLPTFRQMLVNHEVGHLLGQHHPRVQCPGRGRQAPIMAQQTTELDGCLPNPWPLDWEVDLAARHELPLAPPYER